MTAPRAPFGRREAGQGVVEYGLIFGLSSALAAMLLLFFGDAVAAVLAEIARAVDATSRP